MSNPEESPLVFPCDYPIKVLGPAEEDFVDHVVALVRRHAPGPDAAEIRVQPSREGRWVSVTMTIRATSREQLEALSRDLREDPRVKACF